MGKFIFTQTEIPGVVVIEPQVFGDDRGYFMETYQKDQFAEAGIDKEFVQDNQSRSTRGVLRGLHFQKNHTQGKLVRVTKGEVYAISAPMATTPPARAASPTTTPPSMCSGRTAAVSTRPAQRTSCTSPLPPRSSSILKSGDRPWQNSKQCGTASGATAICCGTL